jgi:hypothetical protein
MSTVEILPDVQAVVTKFINDSGDISALDARAGSKMPDTSTFTRPFIRVSQLDLTDDPVTAVEYLVTSFIQFDCYAGGGDNNKSLQASQLSRTLRAVLKSLQGQTVEGVVVTQVVFTSHAHIPDEAFTPWRERYVLDAEISVHA